ncbi:hypothetical protein [Marinovum sp.]|uniref:hypothetical protein n=1 Tax=Marinovum sp. TaxID=2024839 RepID=UPI003A8D7A4D
MSDDLAKLQAAQGILAELVIEDPVYIPVFERIEREISLLEHQQSAIERARAVVARHKAMV